MRVNRLYLLLKVCEGQLHAKCLRNPPDKLVTRVYGDKSGACAARRPATARPARCSLHTWRWSRFPAARAADQSGVWKTTNGRAVPP